MKTYGTFEQVKNMNGCMKRPILLHAIQINEPFRVDILENDYMHGKSGDYLIRGTNEELFICDKHIFEKYYDFV